MSLARISASPAPRPPSELSRVYAFICERRSPRWAEQRFLFKAYITQLALARDASNRPR